MFYKFKEGDLLYSRIKTYPRCDFVIYNGHIYYNNIFKESGSFTNNVTHTPNGYISLHEINVDRPSTSMVYPFVVKGSEPYSLKAVSKTSYHSDYSYGDTITGSYPLSSSITRNFYSAGSTRSNITALKNTLNYYSKWSPHHSYNTEIGLGDKSTQEIGLISIPSIFYGSSIRKGSVDLKFYVSGTMISRAQDLRQNGELVQTEPSGSNQSGSVAGVVLYNEGFMVLTGTWDLTTEHTEVYTTGGGSVVPRWTYFGFTNGAPSSSFSLSFEGVNYVNTITMNCHARKGELNFSNNPTFIDRSQSGSLVALTSSVSYREREDIQAKNIVKSPWTGYTGSYEKITYISKIGIFDDDKNLIAIAKLARPLRKREADDYLIKLKTDIF
ncbi:MAG: hypothetical protein Q8P20_11160 [bacterium]|nr:hypothetical protein [bacterium]